MTKAIVAAKVAEATGLSRKETVEAIEEFLNCVKSALKDDKKVSLVGFGTFYIKEKGGRNGRNPRTGERIRIPDKKVATFKPGKAFREMVNAS
ncbi:MAG: DNA-binding protein HU 1 [candidate division BRC1 bacterium ADurb.BinA364]|nr:MAG: DNA-binding protein HU 1 [candidate division BRC1 bacterium ADurb.BinA364]